MKNTEQQRNTHKHKKNKQNKTLKNNKKQRKPNKTIKNEETTLCVSLFFFVFRKQRKTINSKETHRKSICFACVVFFFVIYIFQ